MHLVAFYKTAQLLKCNKHFNHPRHSLNKFDYNKPLKSTVIYVARSKSNHCLLQDLSLWYSSFHYLLEWRSLFSLLSPHLYNMVFVLQLKTITAQWTPLLPIKGPSKTSSDRWLRFISTMTNSTDCAQIKTIWTYALRKRTVSSPARPPAEHGRIPIVQTAMHLTMPNHTH